MTSAAAAAVAASSSSSTSAVVLGSKLLGTSEAEARIQDASLSQQQRSSFESRRSSRVEEAIRSEKEQLTAEKVATMQDESQRAKLQNHDDLLKRYAALQSRMQEIERWKQKQAPSEELTMDLRSASAHQQEVEAQRLALNRAAASAPLMERLPDLHPENRENASRQLLRGEAVVQRRDATDHLDRAWSLSQHRSIELERLARVRQAQLLDQAELHLTTQLKGPCGMATSVETPYLRHPSPQDRLARTERKSPRFLGGPPGQEHYFQPPRARRHDAYHDRSWSRDRDREERVYDPNRILAEDAELRRLREAILQRRTQVQQRLMRQRPGTVGMASMKPGGMSLPGSAAAGGGGNSFDLASARSRALNTAQGKVRTPRADMIAAELERLPGVGAQSSFPSFGKAAIQPCLDCRRSAELNHHFCYGCGRPVQDSGYPQTGASPLALPSSQPDPQYQQPGSRQPSRSPSQTATPRAQQRPVGVMEELDAFFSPGAVVSSSLPQDASPTSPTFGGTPAGQPSLSNAPQADRSFDGTRRDDEYNRGIGQRALRRDARNPYLRDFDGGEYVDSEDTRGRLRELEYVAAARIQQAWRAHVRRKNSPSKRELLQRRRRPELVLRVSDRRMTDREWQAEVEEERRRVLFIEKQRAIEKEEREIRRLRMQVREEREKRENAARAIQSAWRGRTIRSKVVSALDQARRARSRVQERKAIAKKIRDMERKLKEREVEEQTNAARIVQKNVRGWMTRQDLKRKEERRLQQEAERRNRAADREAARKQARAFEALQKAAAIRVQSAIRGNLARSRLRKEQEAAQMRAMEAEKIRKAMERWEQREEDRRLEAAALRLQSVWRGKRARRTTLAKQENARRTRAELERRLEKRRLELRLATMPALLHQEQIRQQDIKNRALEKQLMMKRLEEIEARHDIGKEKAAARIQAVWRGRKTRMDLANGKLNDAAATIQRHVRGSQARRSYKSLAVESQDKIRWTHDKVAELRRETQEHQQHLAWRLAEIERLKILVALGNEEARCHQCDLAVCNCHFLLQGGTRICRALYNCPSAPGAIKMVRAQVLAEVREVLAGTAHTDPQLAELAVLVARARR